MSCNGCRVLRRGCSDACLLRPCLQWIPTPQAQGNATLFVAKFFGRSDLLSKIDSVPSIHRPALFQSLLFEACGRTVNPIGGAVGLVTSGNWNLCEAAVETVLAGGVLRPVLNPPNSLPVEEESGVTFQSVVQGKRTSPKSSPLSADVLRADDVVSQAKYQSPVKQGRSIMMSFDFTDESEALTNYCRGIGRDHHRQEESDPPKLLNLFM